MFLGLFDLNWDDSGNVFVVFILLDCQWFFRSAFRVSRVHPRDSIFSFGTHVYASLHPRRIYVLVCMNGLHRHMVAFQVQESTRRANICLYINCYNLPCFSYHLPRQDRLRSSAVFPCQALCWISGWAHSWRPSFTLRISWPDKGKQGWNKHW